VTTTVGRLKNKKLTTQKQEMFKDEQQIRSPITCEIRHILIDLAAVLSANALTEIEGYRRRVLPKVAVFRYHGLP
jgi:hypothetical protein